MNVKVQVPIRERQDALKNDAPEPPRLEDKGAVNPPRAAMIPEERFFTNQNITILLGGVTLGAIIGEIAWAEPGKVAVIGIFLAFLLILLLRKRKATSETTDLRAIR